jgi:hypothetical protein
MAGLQEIGRHAGAHAPESDKANIHGVSPSLCNQLPEKWGRGTIIANIWKQLFSDPIFA